MLTSNFGGQDAKYTRTKSCLPRVRDDQLLSEIQYVDRILKLIGFPDGLETIKSAAQEVIEEEGEE